MASTSQQQQQLQATRAAQKAADAAEKRERLKRALPATVELLQSRQADRIDDRDIDAYVDLNWLEWHGGGLRLTITGRKVGAHSPATAVA